MKVDLHFLASIGFGEKLRKSVKTSLFRGFLKIGVELEEFLVNLFCKVFIINFDRDKVPVLQGLYFFALT